MARWDIMAADISGSHGGTPDVLIINELSHVTKWQFIENLMSNAAGVPRGIVIVATNAGIIGSEAERWKKNALANENWAVRIWADTAPWIGHQHVKEQRQQLREPEYQRLWRGVWISGTGAALKQGQISKCFVHKGPLDGPIPGWVFIAGLDLGVKHDRAICMQQAGLVGRKDRTGIRRGRRGHVRWRDGGGPWASVY